MLSCLFWYGEQDTFKHGYFPYQSKCLIVHFYLVFRTSLLSVVFLKIIISRYSLHQNGIYSGGKLRSSSKHWIRIQEFLLQFSYLLFTCISQREYKESVYLYLPLFFFLKVGISFLYHETLSCFRKKCVLMGGQDLHRWRRSWEDIMEDGDRRNLGNAF